MTAKFVIHGQSRSGSTLLVELINTHPDIYCDRELKSSSNRQPPAAETG